MSTIVMNWLLVFVSWFLGFFDGILDRVVAGFTALLSVPTDLPDWIVRAFSVVGAILDVVCPITTIATCIAAILFTWFVGWVIRIVMGLIWKILPLIIMVLKFLI